MKVSQAHFPSGSPQSCYLASKTISCFHHRLILAFKNFWINPLSVHFSQIKVSHLVLVNEQGEVQPGGAQAPINDPAFAIHSEIYKARLDLDAACQAHSVYGKAFSRFGRVIEPLQQDTLRLYNDLSGIYPSHNISNVD
jgi:ribulose-5-phosphate 4-epimerase/fuculose-1-phosphate aldolase